MVLQGAAADDYGDINQDDSAMSNVEKPKCNESKGKKRDWLHVYETAPLQRLNAYGQTKYNKLHHGEWKAMSQPLKTRAQ